MCSRNSDRIQLLEAEFNSTLLSYAKEEAQSLHLHIILDQGPRYINFSASFQF